MKDYEQFEEQRLKHLEMIQAVVGRLAGNSFIVKGWAVTVAGAFSGLALNAREPWLAAVGIVTTFFFWALDCHFLRSERLFRVLYEQVRRSDEDVTPFYLGATAPAFVRRVKTGETVSARAAASWLRTALRGTLVLLYGALAAVSVVVAVIAASLPLAT